MGSSSLAFGFRRCGEKRRRVNLLSLLAGKFFAGTINHYELFLSLLIDGVNCSRNSFCHHIIASHSAYHQDSTFHHTALQCNAHLNQLYFMMFAFTSQFQFYLLTYICICVYWSSSAAAASIPPRYRTRWQQQHNMIIIGIQSNSIITTLRQYLMSYNCNSK